MRILVLNRSYYPDVEATGQLLTELCSDLAQQHDVTVIAGQPNFVAVSPDRAFVQRDSHQGVNILRVRNVRFTKKSLLGRACGLLTYLFVATWAAVRFRKPDVIVVETDPPLLGALGAFLKWWHGCPLVHYTQDLFPELGLALGRFRPGPLTWLLRLATQIGFRHADRVIVLGEDMRQRILARGVPAAKIDIVPNWADITAIGPRKADNAVRRELNLADRFTMMYSGNIGLSQNLEPLLEVAKQLQGEPIEFLLIGEGAAKQGLQAQAEAWGLRNVRFLPYQPKERLAESLSAPDIHYIPLRRGLAGCIVPSKLYGILAAGTAYIAAVEAASEVALVTHTHSTGILIEPDSAEQLLASLRWCLDNRASLYDMGVRGRALAETTFNRACSVDRFEQSMCAAVGNCSGEREQHLQPNETSSLNFAGKAINATPTL